LVAQYPPRPLCDCFTLKKQKRKKSHNADGENRDSGKRRRPLALSTRGRRTKAGAKAKAVERVAGNRGSITKAAGPRFCGGRRQRRRAEERSEDAGGWTKRARAKRAMGA